MARGGGGLRAEGDELQPVLINGRGRCCKQQHFPRSSNLGAELPDML